jgi:DNA-binding LacI/PurR family transcriptional regulator
LQVQEDLVDIRRINMTQIAAELGLSVATVSRALNLPDKVKPDTLERVLGKVAEYGYVSNVSARDLTRPSASILGVILPSMEHEAFATTMHAIQAEALRHNLSVLTGVTNYDPEAARELVMTFLQRRVAGIVFIGLDDNIRAEVRAMARRGIPCVALWELVDLPPVRCVGIDNRAAAAAMTTYLVGLGHRRIALITGPTHAQRVRDRIAGTSEALKGAGLSLAADHVLSAAPTFAAGGEAMAKLLARPTPPTAVFAAGDQLAIGAIAEAHRQGLAVPRDVSICGFDDIGVAAFTVPPLTTIRVSSAEMGRLAVDMIRAETDPNMPAVVNLGFELIVRDSCGPPL